MAEGVGKAAATGALSGAAKGAAIGSFIPGIGTAIGAGVGALVGAFSGGRKHKKQLEEEAAAEELAAQQEKYTLAEKMKAELTTSAQTTPLNPAYGAPVFPPGQAQTISAVASGKPPGLPFQSTQQSELEQLYKQQQTV